MNWTVEEQRKQVMITNHVAVHVSKKDGISVEQSPMTRPCSLALKKQRECLN